MIGAERDTRSRRRKATKRRTGVSAAIIVKETCQEGYGVNNVFYMCLQRCGWLHCALDNDAVAEEKKRHRLMGA